MNMTQAVRQASETDWKIVEKLSGVSEDGKATLLKLQKLSQDIDRREKDLATKEEVLSAREAAVVEREKDIEARVKAAIRNQLADLGA